MTDAIPLLIDGHLDLAMNALYLNRDLRLSAYELREIEAGQSGSGRGAGTIGFPDLRRGNIALSFVTVIARTNTAATSDIDFRTREIAFAQAQGQLAWYREHDRAGDIRLITNQHDLDEHLAAWETNSAATPLGVILTMEGADPVVDPGQLELWHQDGLRILSLAHYGPSAYAHGTRSIGGLRGRARELLDQMVHFGIGLDITHLSDESFWEALDYFQGIVLATHSNCRALVPGDRQLTDDMLQALFERDAVIGSVLDTWMLQLDWIDGETKPTVTLDAVVDHIDYICQLAGNCDHAAIGSDLDGGYGIEQTPTDLDTIADLQKIPDLLAKRGYGQANIDAIMHGNWQRLLGRLLPP